MVRESGAVSSVSEGGGVAATGADGAVRGLCGVAAGVDEGRGAGRATEVLAEAVGGSGVLELPTDRARPAVQTNAGAIVPFVMRAELSAGLKEMSRREGVTLFMTLLGAFQVLLRRYSGERDVAVGAPIAGRRWKEIEGLIGFFVNTLVMRTKIKGGESFGELLEGVRETTLEAYRHQDVPFEKLVEELQPERKLNTTPLFQVMFVLQNAPPGEVRLAGLTLSDLPGETSTERKFDLSMETVEYAGRIEGSLRYRTDLFDEITIRRMVGHWETLLQGMAQDSTKAVSCLPMLPLAEWEQVVLEWNQTELKYPAAHAHELFEAHAFQIPDAVAVVHEEEQLTYSALNRQANQLGHYLRKLGVGPEVRVGLYVERQSRHGGGGAGNPEGWWRVCAVGSGVSAGTAAVYGGTHTHAVAGGATVGSGWILHIRSHGHVPGGSARDYKRRAGRKPRRDPGKGESGLHSFYLRIDGAAERSRGRASTIAKLRSGRGGTAGIGWAAEFCSGATPDCGFIRDHDFWRTVHWRYSPRNFPRQIRGCHGSG